jgi:methionine-rich copper-binding protein CopC
MMGRYRWLGLVITALAALLLIPSSVYAHADYESSTPARDEVVAAAPAQVDVFFTQEVARQEGRYFVRVFDDSGTQVSDGDGVIDDDDRTHISTSLQSGLPAGRYIVRWLTLSFEDGDDDEGAFCFFIAVEPTQAEADECAALAGDEGETPAAPTEPSAATGEPTQAGPGETPAVSPSPTEADTADGEDDDNSTVLIVAIVGAVIAVVVIGGGAVVWLRRTLE